MAVERAHLAVASIVLLGACALVTNLDDLGHPGDSGIDVALDTPPTCFALGVAPSFVTMDPGDKVTIGIQVARAAGFTDTITFIVSGGPPDMSASTPNPLVGTAAKTSFEIDLPDAGGSGEYTIVVTATAGACAQQANIALHIGSVLVADDAGILSVPDGASFVVVKVWGAAGGSYAYVDGAVGGGGGFASAKFDVPPGGIQLHVVEGTGGQTSFVSGAGGGGGFSGVEVGSTWWIIAGGGGGSGTKAGTLGGGGGGATGGVGQGCGAGTGGTPSAGGTGGTCATEPGEAGAPFVGGNGGGSSFGSTGPGGVPGGGAGMGGGGGGGGWFGGGGGSGGSGGNAGGGGGSAYVRDGGLDATTIVAASSTAASSGDTDYVAGVGSANVGGNNGKGGPGRVVVRLVKP